LGRALTDYVVGGGKRLRPAFCFWGARAAGHPDTDPIVRAAASLDLLHACALAHDDVIDHSDTRRGQPALHRRFEQLHAESGWTGDSADFGAATAILAGDVLLAWSGAMLAASGVDDDALRRARPVLDAMRTEVMSGQYLDIVEQARSDGTVESAMRVARYKSAKYTVERPLHLGAALAGAPAEIFQAYTAYGLPLGEAFQLRDDLLGVFGDPAVTGKPAGDDLREGKRTALIALAIERAEPSAKARIVAALGDAALDDPAVAEVRSEIAATGATKEVERMIDDRVAAARDALESAPLDPAGRDALLALVDAATSRVE
jgi:geranylgeranyl diphosphate synthase type I